MQRAPAPAGRHRRPSAHRAGAALASGMGGSYYPGNWQGGFWMNILLLGNCQGAVIRDVLEAGGRHRVERLIIHSADASKMTPDYLAGFDVIIAQDMRPDLADLWRAIRTHPRVILYPWLLFFGFHPDHTVVQVRPGNPSGAVDNVSRIIFAAWCRGLSPAETEALYNPEFVSAMGYREELARNRDVFLERLSAYTSRAEALFSQWFDRGVFFHTGNHPKSFVIEDMLREVLAGQDIDLPRAMVSDFMPDPLARLPILPILNHPQATNLLDNPSHVYKVGERLIPLPEMIAQLYRQFDAISADIVRPERDLARFDAAHAAWTGRVPEPMTNPYARRPAFAFWSRAVARPAPEAVSPGDGLRAVIAPETRVATAGSCFAQHVARAMVQGGLTYYVAETAPADMDAETAEARGYGLFSARYGNIYSTRQLLQLIRRAYGRFTPAETAWPVEGGFVDPFRPNIGETFASVAALEAARAGHLAHVRRMFETLDVFVFTLGLTEGWVDRRDGAAYPVTPGSVTKGADPAHFEFLNLDHAAVKADLLAFLGELFAVNPKAQVILTVSPVPLIATYGPDDVLSATTYSKSVLRAVAGEVAGLFGAVQYFPSYEIITGGFNRGAYFAEDLRSVRPEGVAHVMRVFRERLVIGAAGAEAPAPAPEAAADSGTRAEIAEEIARQMRIVCDEELLVRDL